NRILAEFEAEGRPEYQWSPNIDVRPTTQIPIIRRKNGHRELTPVRWGLVPPWEPEPKTKFSTINARAETVAEKPTYRSAFKKKRCLIVADGYDEWKVVGGRRRSRSSNGTTSIFQTTGCSRSRGSGSTGSGTAIR